MIDAMTDKQFIAALCYQNQKMAIMNNHDIYKRIIFKFSSASRVMSKASQYVKRLTRTPLCGKEKQQIL